MVSDQASLVRKLSERIDPQWVKILHGPAARTADAKSEDVTPETVGADLVLAEVSAKRPQTLEQAIALASRLRDTPTGVLVLADGLSHRERTALYRAGVLDCISLDAHPEELAAHLTSLLTATHPASEALRRLREYTRHLDEQLRLAQRLQMDFLPHRLPRVEGAKFAARLEPAAWVAGDFYDIFRLDEQHVGFYVADAIGHGIPAALLTVFVKKSLQTKHIEGKHYELIGPDEALRLLNLDLLSAELQETPFITMAYGLYNEATRECVYARAGHPRPLLLQKDGTLEELEGEGPLLGIFRNAKFPPVCKRLEDGQRLILYTDGAERVEPTSVANTDRLFQVIQANAALPLETMLDTILQTVRNATRDGRLADDVTFVALELQRDEKTS